MDTTRETKYRTDPRSTSYESKSGGVKFTGKSIDFRQTARDWLHGRAEGGFGDFSGVIQTHCGAFLVRLVVVYTFEGMDKY